MVEQKVTVEEICGLKIHVMRKVYLTNDELECRKYCDGRNKECQRYIPYEKVKIKNETPTN